MDIYKNDSVLACLRSKFLSMSTRSYARESRDLSIGLAMAGRVGWEHVKSSYWKFNGHVYDLDNVDLKTLDKTIKNLKPITRSK